MQSDDRRPVAILGAGGLLGRHFAQELVPRHPIVALERAACDVTELDQVVARTRGAGAILNCAAFTDVDGAEARADEAFRINALGAAHAARAAREHDATLVHISTDFVFDGMQAAPYHEGATPNPQSAYARGKLEGERQVAEIGGRVFLVRVQALYGAGGRSFSSRLRGLVLSGKPLLLDRERRVQPTWARAAARQIARLLTTEVYGTYHVSCTGETTWAAYARRLAERLGVTPAFREVPSAELATVAARPRNCVFEHRALVERGLFAMPSWEVALDEYLAEARGA